MIITREDNFFLVKVFKDFILDIDIYDKDSIMELFKSVLVRLTKRYDLHGLVDIDVYIDDNFGMIMEINKIHDSYISSCLDDLDEMDVRIHFHIDAVFMNEIDSQDVLNHKEVYYYQDKFYTVYDKDVDSHIIYKGSYEIMDKGVRVV